MTKSKKNSIMTDKALNAFKAMQQSIVQREIPEMGLDEINAEIKAARSERKSKKAF